MNIGINVSMLNGREKITGIGYYTYQVVKNLLHIDDENYYYLFSNDDLCVDFGTKNNYEIVVLKNKSGRKLFWSVFTLGLKLKKYNLDVFWAPAHYLPLIGKRKINYCVTIHDLANFKLKNISVESSKLLSLQQFFIRKSCQLANGIIAVSEATKLDVINMFGIAPEKINVVYESGDWGENEESQEGETAASPYDKPYLLYVGTLQPRKNIITIVNAYINLRKSCDSDAVLVLAGGTGWGMEETLDLIKNNPYAEDIILEGYVSDDRKRILYQHAEAFAFPSLYEGFGLPILEAFHYGTPVITAKNSSLTEVGGDAALYLEDTNDAEALSALMYQVLNMNEEERNCWIEKGKNQLAKFSWGKCAQETRAILCSNVNDDF